MTFKNELGKTYGKLRVIEHLGRLSKSSHSSWLCRCECGNYHTSTGTSLRENKVTQCTKCSNTSRSIKHSTHGQSHGRKSQGSATYRSWVNMKKRCYYIEDINYHNYGGRGIKVCDAWLGIEGFSNFIKDMGERPNGHSLDRINVNGDYCSDNCRWATHKEQSRNTTYNVVFEINDERLCLVEIAERLGIPYNRAYYRFVTKGLDVMRYFNV